MISAIALFVLVGAVISQNCIDVSKSKYCSGIQFMYTSSNNVTTIEDFDNLVLNDYINQVSSQCGKPVDVQTLKYGYDFVCSAMVKLQVSTQTLLKINNECTSANDISKYVLCKSSCQSYANDLINACPSLLGKQDANSICSTLPDNSCYTGKASSNDSYRIKIELSFGLACLALLSVFF